MSDGPTLRQLSYFLSSVEHGSFSAAAEHEHVAQPSLSEQIRRLERALGATLFVRTNRSLRLTDVGRLLVPLAEATLRSADLVAATAREATTLTGGLVSFGTFSSAHRYLLTPLITEFHERYPDVRIQIVGLNSSEVARAVRAGDLEAGLVQLPVDTQGLVVGRTLLVDTVVYVSADARRTQRPVTIEDLARADLVLSEARWRADDPLRRSIAERARAAGVVVEPFVEVEVQSAAMELAANGVGDTLVSYLVARSHESANRVTWATLDPPFEERFAFVTRAGGGLSPATRQFMVLARRHISALQEDALRARAKHATGTGPTD
ncbi:Transcriptional regulator, LysR family [Nostocoides japonicum T1-X7]|uniref:Transcriptional regulator, LysR family n=1 Tax=Nostocoides japonicum T1-X7 TaxID=1194083 RepID=A0A077LY19_9MICO|nr:LysR family transcriptional regulator [Tetrasphaera japonica]CCH76835.1 Transcriptional regulator, LysR family [Tetrasphaera japonica T1-X7]